MSDTAFAALARARQAAGLTLEEAARQLKFAPRQLEALEAGELQRLPGGPIVRGMVRSYARLLRVDPEPLLAQIAAQVPPPDAERLAQRYRQPVPFSDGARHSNILYVVLSLVLLVAVAAVALQWRQEQKSTGTLAFVSAAQMPAEPARADSTAAPAGAESSGPAPAAKAPAPATTARESGRAEQAATHPGASAPPAKPVTAAAAPAKPPAAAPAKPPAAALAKPPAAAAPPAKSASVSAAPASPVAEAPPQGAPAGTGRITLEFDGESWVEIRSGSGKLLVASLHSAGTERLVSGLAPFEVVIGNAQQVRLTYNGKPVDLSPYVKVEVARFTLQ